MLLGVLGIAAGIALGLYFPGYFPEVMSGYMGVALLACIDSIIGGFSAKLRGAYSDSVFISGFFINAVLAAAMVYFGERINLQLELAAVVVFVSRIFQNLAVLRRNLLNLNSE